MVLVLVTYVPVVPFCGNLLFFTIPMAGVGGACVVSWSALSVLVTALAAIFIASVLANPVLPSFNLAYSIPSLPRLQT